MVGRAAEVWMGMGESMKRQRWARRRGILPSRRATMMKRIMLQAFLCLGFM
jgi:hypothetical protein